MTFSFPRISGTVLTLLTALFISPARGEDGANGLERRTLLSGGVERSYYLHQPAPSAAGQGVRPLVIVLHGGGGNGKFASMMSGFNAKADQEGFLAAYPNGSGRFSDDRWLTWNARHCSVYAMRENTGDVAFLSDLIDVLVKIENVDPARVYVTGLSNGAMMAYRAGLELTHKIAAIAPVAGAMFGDETPAAAPLPVLIFHGRTDRNVPFDGGPPLVRFGRPVGDADYRPVYHALNFWAKANRCAASPAITRQPDMTVTLYEDCADGASVKLYALEGGGHSWPGGKSSGRRFGGDKPVQSPVAVDVIWAFFKQHHR